MLPIFGRRNLVLPLEEPVEMAGIGIAHGINDLLNRDLRVSKKLTGSGHFNILYQVCEVSAGIFFQNPRHLTLTVIEELGQFH